MGQELFRFKQFGISHSASTMKVGTDAVLLGSWTDVSNAKNILDVGTGCGIIALMLAQRSEAMIDAIDIDKNSVEEAGINFKASPWSSRLRAFPVSLREFWQKTNERYDLIVSNPPFFSGSLLPEDKKRRQAKHTVTLNYDELLHISVKLLRPAGRLAVILPFDAAGPMTRAAETEGLLLTEGLTIFPKPKKQANRIILVYGKSPAVTPQKFSSLILRNENGGYSESYQRLTAEFHPDF